MDVKIGIAFKLMINTSSSTKFRSLFESPDEDFSYTPAHKPISDEVLYTELLELAAEHGRVDLVHELMERGVQPSDTALCNAVSSGNIRLVNLFLATGMHANCFVDYNLTPISCAASRGDMKMLRFLLAKGARLTRTATNAAAYHGQAAMFSYLLEHCDEPINEDTMSALLHSGNEEMIRLACTHGGVLKEMHIEQALYKNKVEIIRLAFREGAVMQPKYLRLAITRRSLPIVRLLLDLGATVNEDLIEHALRSGSVDMLDELLAHLGRMDDKPYMQQLFDLAVDEAEICMMDYLLDKGASLATVNIANLYMKERTKMLHALIERGADIESKDGYITALDHAALHRDIEGMEYLTIKGARVRLSTFLSALFATGQDKSRRPVEFLLARHYHFEPELDEKLRHLIESEGRATIKEAFVYLGREIIAENPIAIVTIPDTTATPLS